VASDQRQQGGVGLEEAAAVARGHEGLAADAEDAALHAEAPDLLVGRGEEDAAARLGGRAPSRTFNETLNCCEGGESTPSRTVNETGRVPPWEWRAAGGA
jgi:hypothetical protein